MKKNVKICHMINGVLYSCSFHMKYEVFKGLFHMGLVLKTCLWGVGTTKEQTSLRSLISAFVIRFLESIMSKFATGESSIF